MCSAYDIEVERERTGGREDGRKGGRMVGGDAVGGIAEKRGGGG